MERNRITFSEAEAAEYVGLAQSTLRKARIQANRPGHISAPPFLQIGRRIRYLKNDLDHWLAAQRIDNSQHKGG